LSAGAFSGNGAGWRANGVPLTFKDEVWTVGFGVTYKFGAPAAAAPSYPVKALPAK
jgi:hypothetical protein